MSLGVAMFDGAAVTPEDMIVNADLAMYDAKEAGRDRLALYATAEHRHSRSKARLTWVDRIDAALRDDGFLLEAQPIRDLATGAVSQYELLIRMRGHDGDVIPPAAFLYVAERFGLVGGIDSWVARQAIDLIAEHQRAGHDLRLEVNLSARSLGEPTLLAAIEERLETTGIDPSAPDLRDHRDRRGRELPAGAGLRRPAARPRLRVRARRLRRRLRLVLLPQAPAVRLPEDRRRVRRQLRCATPPTG